jgi:hypothetical protein
MKKARFGAADHPQANNRRKDGRVRPSFSSSTLGEVTHRQSIQRQAASPDVRHLQIPVQQNDVRVGAHAQRAFFEFQSQ